MSSVLISGASIAGPALAFWLRRRGFDVTVVEKSHALRGGGYPIDIRGTALGVVERMGLLPRLREAHVDTRRITFLDAGGAQVASVRPEALTGGDGNDLEVRRGDLAEILYAVVRNDVEFLFDNTIVAMNEHPGGVDVTFRSGLERTYDHVIGADGLHSVVRELTFGPEERFHRYLGYCFAGFTLPNHLGLRREALLWNEPGRAAALYAVGSNDSMHGFLSFARAEAPFRAFRDPQAQRDLVEEVFGGDGWEVPQLVKAMHEADDLFFDAVSQIRMPRWSSGRVALAGDAAHAPSFLTGQGSSLALVGAYVLAGNMNDFGAYERTIRPFVEANQNLVDVGNAELFPGTAEALAARNAALRSRETMPAEAARPEHSALTLPEFGLRE
ncbi:FAD-dependent monooxygenase [Lentzea flaviverrucosa]|uniref:2-polyprenyl-6-methoxyphenol hydroxylase n=1 Tax=Lentzea flaviverrucosa TaxID=200379 RepID=A0A1H9KJU9_9PSEU|nr:FAD-dependent monooxygenase [Lentzea flaviverrucosa]RDI17900.1 2-polyprenyl-6-methoxyphenol hydroxylase-like FAD-dependent oxidoreductase [Lentzea flaviverrucosa]SEQ99426.1 2-polyprenyl-6-methoxyphenol hydroxylase [Lentzea flaviverrucosa]